ncbi:hypothetical protein Ocin01_11991 [Orchesella cincta]|uniref:Uncharacterized protein n=1 Tax=Orchesella cincta TaxID=48709 RepID=A0A1D2MPA0_ORCCI|nr:hypothetical protein Ocin01_11991 [Orchesella cincta]
MKPTRNKGGSKNAVLAIGKPSKALSPPKLETEAEKEDENEPYTPWDEDEKSEVVPDSAVPSSSSTSTPLLPAPSQSGSAVIIETQKQLEELEAQIAKQKEDIVSILQGAAKNVVGIPGLDGDFPESLPEDNAAAESQNKQDVPVFLRPTPVLSSLDPRSTRSSIFKHQQLTVNTTKVPATTIPGLDLEIRESCGDDDVVVIEQEENSKSHHSLKPIPEVAVDAPKEVENSAEEAYSPSAMDFSDDDVVCEDDDLLSNTTQKVPDDKHVKDNKTGGRFMFGQSSDDSGVKEKIDAKNAESQSKEPLIVDLDERQTEEIKIILSKINTPVIPIAHHSSSEKHVGLLNKTLLDGTVDLVDDSEPPPPGENSAPSLPPLSVSPLTKSSKVFDDSPFEKSPLLTNNQSRVKININLSTKMLPLSTSKKEIDKNSASFAVDSSEPSLDCPVEPTMFKDIDERILAKEGLPPPIIPETIPLPPVDFKTVPPPVVINQPLTTLVPSVPLHIPPPPLQSSSGSVVINLNVPPPPFITIPPQLTGIRFPSTQAPSAQQVAAPTFLSRPPPSTPPRNQFSPIDTSSSSGRQSRTGPGPHSTLFKSMSSSPKEAEDRGMTEKDKDDRNYLARQDKGRGSYSQDRRRTHDRVERVKRNRSRSKSRDRSRSRSRSRSRDRKRRRRHSRSRSPVRRSSRRNRSRSRSRSPVL